MGNGTSSADIDAHLKKWEAALGDLTALCNTNKRALGFATSASAANPPHIPAPPVVTAEVPVIETSDENGGTSLRGRRASSLVSFGANKAATPAVETCDTARSNKPDFFGDEGNAKSEEKNKNPKHNRQHIMEVRKARFNLFKSYVDIPLSEITNKLACDHFATIAIALSSVLGGHCGCQERKDRVTVEDIFFAAHVPLHLLHTESMHLTEVFDVVREFLDVDNRFKGQYQVEVLHFDIAPTVGQVELGTNEVGDRQTRLQLPDFRKGVMHELDECEKSVIIVNYDPFVLEQEMTMDDDDDEDEEEEQNSAGGGHLGTGGGGLLGVQQDALMASVMKPGGGILGKKPQYQKNNKGAYAALIDYRNAVQFMVSLGKAAVSDKLHLEITEVPLNGLFKAIMSHEPGQRARGYLRISRRNQQEDGPKADKTEAEIVDSTTTFFSPELCSGKVVGSTSEGTHAHTLQPIISPHIVAFSWALHLINGASENAHNHGQGLPVGDIIRTLGLPSDVFLESHMPLEQVYLYADAYLKRKQLNEKFKLELCPVLTRVSRENAVPTISIMDFEEVLIDIRSANEDPEAPSCIMIIQYNADVAHNVLGIAKTPQWCILCGYDPESQSAILIDANSQKFCATWTCPIDRLHKAITTYGYLLLTRGDCRIAANSNRPVPSVVQARIDIINTVKHQDFSEVVTNFPTPPVPFGITAMSLALNRLGLNRCNFDDIVKMLPFHPSALFDSHFGLQAFIICINKYLLSINENEKYTATAFHFDRDFEDNNKILISQSDFREKIVNCLKNNSHTSLLVHYDPGKICILGTMKPFGDFACVVAFDESTSIVTVADCNPNRFYRTWQIPLDKLYESMSVIKHLGRRARGFITIVRNDEPVPQPRPEHYRPFSLQVVPIQKVFQISPSPQVQGLSIALAQLGHYYSPEEIFYEAYLKTVTDQRRRGSQAFAWRDVEVSLGILNKKIDSRVITQVARKFIESRKVTNLAVEQLEDVEIDELPEILQGACAEDAGHVILLCYDTAKAHGLPRMGASVALVQSYDQATDKIGLFEAEYCLFGLQWKCDLAKLIELADLDNPGTSKYGFIKIALKQQEKRVGAGFGNKSGGGGREKVATFV